MVRTDRPYKAVRGLVEAAKAKPEKIRVSTDWLLSDSHLLLLALMEVAGVKFNLVHFEGGFSHHLPAVLGGHVRWRTAGDGAPLPP